MSEQFFVSVIIPVYNGEAYVAEAVASVLRQGHEPLEIIVVDDGSTDATKEVVAALTGPIRYAYQVNAGAPAARNKGLEMAWGNLISFLDADDLWADDKLARQLAILAREPSVDIVLGYTQYIRRAQNHQAADEYERHPNAWPALSLGGASFRRRVFDRVGPLDASLLYDDDVDWYLRAKELGVRMLIHEDVVQYYRRHEDNITNRPDLDRHYFALAVKRSLDRRRRAGRGSAAALGPWRDANMEHGEQSPEVLPPPPLDVEDGRP